MLDISAKKISTELLEELQHALDMIKAYGSIEIYVQDRVVTQITVRNIKKTKYDIKEAKNKITS